MRELTIAILAGGESTRMGSDKTLARLLGRPLLDYVVARLRRLGSEIILITNAPNDHTRFGLPMFGDILPGKGPLGGIYTAISHAASRHVLVVAGDMPFLNRELLRYMIDLAPGFDVVAPRMCGRTEGLHAIYGKGCLDPIRAHLEGNRLKLIGFYDDVRVRYVDEAEIDRFDPDHRSFFNINTLADLEAAQRMAESDGL
jgi:molybdopterin-guanine dinucleotide biosynthesis protein A